MRNGKSCRIIGLSIGLYTLSLSTAGAQTKFIQAVDEYVPAPGQFVNLMPLYVEGDTPETMARKCTDSIGGGHSRPDLPTGKTCAVMLGAYGGYITFHFDHPIANIAGQRDFAVWGNAFPNNAEPAIVMVSQDTNGNGLPDDTFYELRGSEYDNPLTLHNYSVTYTYQPMGDTPWTDSQGATGAVARNDYHKQEYFPLWLADQGKLTFSGALLPKNANFRNGQFLLPAYDYGYADNQPNLIDYEYPNTEGCGLDIGWAVDAGGQPVTLDHIDFVRVYNAMNQTCGWIGETSTEITGAEDLHLDASLNWAEEERLRQEEEERKRQEEEERKRQEEEEAASIRQLVTDGTAHSVNACHDLRGQTTSWPVNGIYISHGKKVFIK